MAIEWNSSLSVGVGLIDKQHQELFRRINDLMEACNQGKGKEAVAKVIGFLEDYVVTHFRDEEALMVKNAYPDYRSHKAQHESFVQSLGGLRQKLEQDGAGLPLVLQTNRMVVQWLTNHISKLDKALGAFLQQKAN